MMVMICARAVPRECAIWVLQRFSAPMHAAPLPAAHFLRADLVAANLPANSFAISISEEVATFTQVTCMRDN